MSVLRLLREPRWLRGLAVAVLIALVCCVLGRWQWHRREDRLAANEPLVANYGAAPVDVTSVLPAGTDLPDEDVWTQVRVSGTYDTDAQVLVRNRPRDEQTGYEVLVPLVLADGTALLVDRGWVPAGDDSARPDAVPAAPAGTVVVTAHLRQFEEQRRGTTPDGQVGSIAQESVTEATGLDLLGGYGLLESEDPAPASSPARAVAPSVDEGPHLAYTVQWFGFALTSLVVWVVAGRRELQARAQGEEGGSAVALEEEPASSGPVAPQSGPRRAPRPARRGGAGVKRRREGSDEAAEDAELDAVDQR